MRWCASGCVLLFAVMLLLPIGCGQAPPPRPAEGSDATSPVDYANKYFAGRPIGAASAKYKPGSAKDGSGGKVRIEDLGGGKYDVEVTPDGKSFKASEPKLVQ